MRRQVIFFMGSTLFAKNIAVAAASLNAISITQDYLCLIN